MLQIIAQKYNIQYQVQVMQSPNSPPTHNMQSHIDRFNFRSTPALSLPTLLEEQFKIMSLEISSHGRTGVIFVETNKGSFVLKANNEGPIDEFFNRMAGLLDLNIAQTITYCCSDLVFHTLGFQIEKYASRDQSFYSRLRSRLNFPFYQIIEYVPSISLAEVGKDRFENYLIEENKLYQLGMCIGFDILTNNSDRFKLLWSSDGNINNVLIEVGDHDAHELHKIRDRSNTEIGLGNYVFIDHSGFLLNLKDPIAAKNFEHYMKRVCDFLISMIRALSQEEYPIPKQFQKLKQQIELYTHYQLTPSDIKRIASGIIYLINKFLQVFQSRAIEELYNRMKKGTASGAKKRKDVENNYWNQYWNDILGKINLNFLQEVFTKMAAIFDTYPEIINGVIKETESKIAEHAKKTNFNGMEQNNTGIGQEKQSQLDPSNNPPQDVVGPEQIPPTEDKQLHPIPQGTQQNPSQIDGKNKQQNNQSNLNPQQLPKDRKWRQRLAKYAQKTSSSPNHKQT